MLYVHTYSLAVVLYLMNYMGRTNLYCSSNNLLDSIYERSTPFCTISGEYHAVAIGLHCSAAGRLDVIIDRC
jgi:hypothetical protein